MQAGDDPMKPISRRRFMKQSAAASVLLGTPLLAGMAGVHASSLPAEPVDLAVARGEDPFAAAVTAVEAFGGMARVVSRGARVGILVNAPFRNPGTHTDPDVALAVVKLCWDAGAKEIVILKDPPGDYWERAIHYGRFTDRIQMLSPSGGYVTRALEKARSLERAEIVRDLFEIDTFINVSIAKHHQGTGFSCILKNMMGALPHATCRYFHKGTGAAGWYGDLEHMNQCIADINRVRPPDLCVVDAVRFITTNGPFGPGALKVENKVVVGRDPVLTDAYCCGFLGLGPDDVGMIQRAEAHGIGTARIDAARVIDAI
jgi:uncharacterized protein (DUF362 family)